MRKSNESVGKKILRTVMYTFIILNKVLEVTQFSVSAIVLFLRYNGLAWPHPTT